MKSIKSSNILKVLAILLFIAAVFANRDSLQTRMSLLGAKVNIAPEGMIMKDGVATVQIVYPREAHEADKLCTPNGQKFDIILFETDTPLSCDMNRDQIRHLADKRGYDKDLFCNCVTDFCGTNPQPAEFVNCLKKPRQL